jgi:putative component of toxin-antitoxin plasmid stabilization module
VGGPKFSQEELRDAYRRRINDAISKVNVTIDVLEAKLGNLGDKGIIVDHPVKSKTQSDPQPKEEQMLVIDSHKEPPLKAVLINTKEERNNPFAVTDFGKDKPHSKTLRADDLQAQISELRYRIDDLKTFDIDSIEQRFDPRVRALGDTVNNTLAEIFGRNTPAYWQYALPSLDSLPVVVGGPKFSQEELRDAYRRRINDAISKVNVTIDVLEAKLGNLGDKGSGGQVLFFAPKAPKYPDIQSLR